MNGSAGGISRTVTSWSLSLLLLPVGLLLGLLIGDSVVIMAAGAAALATLVCFFLVRLSTPVKLIFLLVTVSFLQRILGYFKVGDVRGLNVGNLLLLATAGFFLLRGAREGRFYRRNPIDFALGLFAIVLPLGSMFYAYYWLAMPDYSLGANLSWYKQWVTPFIYFFLICQCLDDQRDIKKLFYLVMALIGLAVLEGLPEALRISNWHLDRSEGIVGQPNDYAALMVTMIPFLFLLLFLLKGRPLLRLLILGFIGSMAVSVVSTYSRFGYIGFVFAFAGALYLTYRATRRLAVLGPGIVIAAMSLLPIAANPQILEGIQERFETKTYQRSVRKSYDRFSALDQYAGGRLSFWKGGIAMAQDYPLFGVGFHGFEKALERYHPLGIGNYPHNLYLGTVAEGGILWFCALLFFLWQVFQMLYQNWRAVLAGGGIEGQVICGGALISFFVMALLSFGNDFFNPNPKTTIFLVITAGAIRFGMLYREQAMAQAALDRAAHGTRATPD